MAIRVIAVRSIVRGRKGGKEEALRIKNVKDFYTGILFMLFGAAFTWGATRYAMGTAAKMGPGYLPFILGGLLTVLGGIVTLPAISRKRETVFVEKE